MDYLQFYGVLAIVLILTTERQGALADEEIIAIACARTNETFKYFQNQRPENTARLEYTQYSSTVSYLSGRNKHCSKLNTISGSRYILRGIFEYGILDIDRRQPILEVSINSVLLRRIDTSNKSVLQVVVDPANSTLEYCLSLYSNVSAPFVSTLELLLGPNLFSESILTSGIRYPARKFSEMQSSTEHSSLLRLASAALISLIVLTTVTALCLSKLFRALHSSPAVQPQPPPKDDSSMDIVLNLQPKVVRKYTLKDLEEAIGSKIAEGGFGCVYRGTLPNRQEVAIKVRSATSTQGLREFTAELTLLSQITHENLVPLLGYCNEGQQQMLVYPYMSNGTLQDRLYGEASKRKPLDWKTRLSIALGAARGLNFLHTCGPRPVIHRDVKSSNILLDDSMNARVADFGFSRFAPQEDDSLVSVEVRGTTGYLDPEYYMTQVLTTKSDVFSFGVVLLEIICGREPLNLCRPRPEASIVDWVRKLVEEKDHQALQVLLDPAISTNYTPEAVWRVVEVACLSVEPNGAPRPDMAGVIRELEDAFIIENNASQYMLSMDSIGSFRRSSSLKAFPASMPFDPSPAFSETLDSPHPR